MQKPKAATRAGKARLRLYLPKYVMAHLAALAKAKNTTKQKAAVEVINENLFAVFHLKTRLGKHLQAAVARMVEMRWLREGQGVECLENVRVQRRLNNLDGFIEQLGVKHAPALN